VNPDLVVRDKNGEIYTVRYDAVNAMLLNEFLKEHRKVEEQDRKLEEQKTTITRLEFTIAEQQQGMETFIAQLKEQAAQIQKVSDQLAAASPSGGGLNASKTAPQIVLNNQ
jgi:septal ring factor EnvC (AmiA/AmiB activator)